MHNIFEYKFDKSIEELKKIFSNSTSSKRLYPCIDEQKEYVKKLNIIFGGFYDYLLNETKLSQKTIEDKLDYVQSFLQFYHLGYSENSITELNSGEFSYYFGNFIHRKCLWVSKSSLKASCRSLKTFVKFLKEKLNYFQDDFEYKDVMDSLNSKEYLELIDDYEDSEDFKNEFDDLNYEHEDSVSIQDKPDKLDGEFMELIRELINKSNLQQYKLEEETNKRFRNSINLTNELNKWYEEEEIKTAEQILENLFKNYSKIKDLNKSELLAAIDYVLSDIYGKKFSQQQIGERYEISFHKLKKASLIIAPYVPIELYYGKFLSKDEISLNKEKTYIFKVKFNYVKDCCFKIELLESQTLEDLHDIIQTIMKWNDCIGIHLHSFFMNGIIWDKDTEYCGPPGSQEHDNTKDTTITLKDLNIGYKQNFLYLYDYGHCNMFLISVIGIGNYDEKKEYPFIIEKNAIPENPYY